MYKKHLALVTILPALLVGCGSSGGSGGSNLQPSTPSVQSSLSTVPAEYRDAVQSAKTFNPMTLVAEDIEAEQGKVIKQITVNGQVLQNGTNSFSDLPNGLSNLAFVLDYGVENDPQSRDMIKGNLAIYQQPYSVVVGSTFTEDSGTFADPAGLGIHYIDDVHGLKTAGTVIDDLTTAGAVFTYSGKAFNGQGQGDLSYQVNFGTREGSGTITGIAETGRIDLLAASIANLNTGNVTGMGIAGNAQFETAPGANITYALGFFGPNAEEIAGKVAFTHEYENTNGISEVGFGGVR